MAESSGHPLSSTARFFCHQCDRNITPLPEFICPRCRSGFVEELDAPAATPAAQPSGPDAGSQPHSVNLTSLLESLYGRFDATARSQESNAEAAAGAAAPMFRLNFPVVGTTGAAFDTTHALEGIIQQILTNVASNALQQSGRDPRSSQVSGRGHTAGHSEFPLPLFQVLHGHPGDYVWGAGGLDSVITQLLNNLDGSGPPPLNQKDIALIPCVEVTDDDVSKNTQCSVCMEDFRLKESVRRLPCAHLYHTECIVPWLQMHGTCPICRKTISVNSSASAAPPADPLAGSGSGSGGAGGSSSSAPTDSSSGSYFDINDYD